MVQLLGLLCYRDWDLGSEDSIDYNLGRKKEDGTYTDLLQSVGRLERRSRRGKEQGDSGGRNR